MNDLPTFLIIGTMKGGTHSLHSYLANHPEVSVSKRKETNFFLGGREYQRGLRWYSSQFDKNAALGEASPNYTKRHLWEGVPERIVRTLPEVRLIYVVRDPIERIVSHYAHNYAHGRERRPLSKAVAAESNYVKTSMYACQLDAFLEHFPIDRILFVDSETLRSKTSSVLKNVFEFIGVTPDYEVPNIDKKYYVTAEQLRRSTLDRYVTHRTLHRTLSTLLPSRLTKPQPFKLPALSHEVSARLADTLRTDTERFRALTGMRFENWSV